MTFMTILTGKESCGGVVGSIQVLVWMTHERRRRGQLWWRRAGGVELISTAEMTQACVRRRVPGSSAARGNS